MNLVSAREEYIRALRLGQKEYREAVASGQDPNLPVLDDILAEVPKYTVQDLPVTEIPAEQIVGVKTAGRTNAFTANFLPLLEPDSEFGSKWITLCAAHLSDEGIREPVLCYEYLGNFYVQEGNKRVSVLKYFGAAKIPSMVKRVLPPLSDEPRIEAYYEFLSFYRDTKIYNIQFRKPGEYAKLLSLLGKEPGQPWTEEERRTFLSNYHYFRESFSALSGKRSEVRPEEALLLWLQVYPLRKLSEATDKERKKALSGLWEDILTGAEQEPVKLKTLPAEEENKGLLGRLITPVQSHLNVAFVHQRDAESSTWTRGHDQGRQYLEETLGEMVTVRSYFNADTPDLAEAALEQAVEEGAQVVFSTTPQLLRPTLKVAVKYPKVRFLNCSADTPFSSVRSYYCRIYEGKFVTGAIAGAMAENDEIGYIGSYPILGVPASINAFALGAQMTNPRAKIRLEWSCMPGSPAASLLRQGIRVISNRDVPTQEPHYLTHGEYGTYLVTEDGKLTPLASPCWMWGRFYENVARSILSGTWEQKKTPPEAVNYWWGMDSGVIDVCLSDEVPESLRSMVRLLTRNMRLGILDPFRRELIDQNGVVRNQAEHELTPKELLHMDWLCENVIGRIPEYEEVLPISQPLMRELGLHRERIPKEKEGTL